MTTLGTRIRKARNVAGKTQEQVADALGVTKGAVSQWESDQTVPELETFKALCRVLDASADYLLLGAPNGEDPLLKQLGYIYEKLSEEGRDELLGKANRLLTKEHPGPAIHDPYPIKSAKHLDAAIKGKGRKRA